MTVKTNKIFSFTQILLIFFLLIMSCSKKNDSSSANFGCNDLSACNYDDDATDDDGSCEYCYKDNCEKYPLANFDCDGDCIVDIDCEDNCGGVAEDDNCGTCDANPYNDCGLIDGEWKAQIEIYACNISYESGNNATITVCAECIENCTNCLDCEVSGFQFNISSDNFIVDNINTALFVGPPIWNYADDGVLALGIGQDMFISLDSNPKELVEFEVEYSNNSGKIFIVPYKGSISVVDRNGEEFSVSTKNKKWSSID